MFFLFLPLRYLNRLFICLFESLVASGCDNFFKTNKEDLNYAKDK